MHSLERFYPGDKGWKEFSDLFADSWQKCPCQEALLIAVEEKDLAWVICAALGEDSITWLDQSVEALDGETPRECLQTKVGRERLKTVLMRMPW